MLASREGSLCAWGAAVGGRTPRGAAPPGRDVVTRATSWECAVLDACGEWRRAAAAAEAAMRDAGRAGLARTAGTLHAADLAGALMHLGRWDEALAIARDALDHAPPPALRAQLLRVAGCISLARGNLDAAAVRSGHDLLSGRDAANADADLPLVRLEAPSRAGATRWI